MIDKLEELKEEAFKKYDDEKPQLNYLLDTPLALAQVAQVRHFGAEKYGRLNWQKCDDLERYTAAALRHIFQAQTKDNDAESGLHHLAHALCCLLFTLELKLGVDEAEE
jgi:hypothetical protein